MTDGNASSQPVVKSTESRFSGSYTPCIHTYSEGGMTILEEFSKAAMQGMLVNGVMTEHGIVSRSPEIIAIMAVRQAKELIKALNDESKP